MRFSQDYLKEILPQDDPPEGYLPEIVRSDLLRLLKYDENLAYRAGLWSYAMFSELNKGEVITDSQLPRVLWGVPPFVPHLPSLLPSLLIGILDPDYETRDLGIIFMAPPSFQLGTIGTIEFPRLKRKFPVVVRALAEDLHVPPSLPNAMSTCWAEDRTQQGQWGILTCRHALSGMALGARVSLGGGGAAVVQRKAPPTVDAAFLATVRPPNPQQMGLVRFTSPGQSVNVLTDGGTVKRSIITATNTLGIINDAYHPIKVYLNQPCQSGDSGALVSALDGGGVGIYCGGMSGATVDGRAGQTVGFAQHLEQAVEILDIIPYR